MVPDSLSESIDVILVVLGAVLVPHSLAEAVYIILVMLQMRGRRYHGAGLALGARRRHPRGSRRCHGAGLAPALS